METIMTILQAIQLNALELTSFIIAFFAVGYWYGKKKSARLQKRVYQLENDLLDLHAELLYGKEETPVIGIRTKSEKIKTIAN